MSGMLTALTDSEVLKSITNISEWLVTYNRNDPQDPSKLVCAEDLAIGVPGECLFPELTQENDEASREDEKGILVYTNNQDEKFIWLRENWHHLEKVLNIMTPKNGWTMTNNLWERLLVLILAQLDYAAKESETEVPYGCCPLSDPAYLLWQNGRPVGMCSLKRKGTSVWGGEDVYTCDTLDTLYIRSPFRRQGHAISLLFMLSSRLSPGEHLALSHPISLNMCKVLLKFIQVYPSLRESLWILDEDGQVAGTVLLMLGSLIVKGVLQPSQNDPSGRASINTEVSSSKTTPMNVQINTHCQMNSSQELCEVDDQRMTS